MTTRERLRAKRAYRKIGSTRAERRAALLRSMGDFFAARSDALAFSRLCPDIDRELAEIDRHCADFRLQIGQQVLAMVESEFSQPSPSEPGKPLSTE